MPASTGTGEQPVVWSRTRFRPDASARVPVQSPPHGTTSRRPGRRRAGFRYARRSESPITALADACGSSRASAAAAQDARSLLRQWRRRLPDAHRRRDVAYAVGDRRQHGRDGPAARSAPVLAYGAEHVPRIRCAPNHAELVSGAGGDQGPEMRDSKQVHVDAGIDVFFCDPHAPWQRGSNQNTNGLLRQYFPKGTDLFTVTGAELDAAADELNIRPRKRLAFANPTEQLAELPLQ
jgi:hypothetical protein